MTVDYCSQTLTQLWDAGVWSTHCVLVCNSPTRTLRPTVCQACGHLFAFEIGVAGISKSGPVSSITSVNRRSRNFRFCTICSAGDATVTYVKAISQQSG